MPIISIIIPVYKAEAYLHRCLDSVLAQTFSDWECILVDDGSPDNSGIICDEYAARNPRFKAIHKENGGASSARNVGIEKAQGEWITFVDADDYIACNMLEHLSDCISEGPDLILGGHVKFDMKGNVLKTRHYERQCFQCSQFSEMLVKGLLIYQKAPWAKMFKTSILRKNNIHFTNGAITGEDEIFLYSYILYCKSVSISDDIGYKYIDMVGSLTSQGTFPYKNALISIHAFSKVSTEIFSRYPEYTWIMHQWTFYVDKLLNSIYKYSTDRKMRIERLQKIDVKKFGKWKQPVSFAEKVLTTMLRLKWYRLYDFVRTLKK